MKKFKSKGLIAAIVLTVLALPAAAFAYFTDYEGAWGGAVLKLEGETQLHEEVSDDQKTISIENIGETDVLVRVAVYGDYLSGTAGEGWVQAEGDEWFYYDAILAPGEKTSDLVAKIDTQAAKDDGHDFDIVVVHESERVSYDGTDENKVNKPDGWTNMPDIFGESDKEVGD